MRSRHLRLSCDKFDRCSVWLHCQLNTSHLRTQGKAMQHVRFEHGQMQLNEIRQGTEYFDPPHKPVPQNSEDIINAMMFSPLSFKENEDLADAAASPPLVLDHIHLMESSSFSTLSQLRQLLNEPSLSIERIPTASVKKQEFQDPTHLSHSHLAATVPGKAVAAKAVHQRVPPAVTSRPSLTLEPPAKIEYLGAAHSNLTKPAGKMAPRVRRYTRAKPSKFCHVCARSGDNMELLACKNVKYGVCRKSVCQRCFGVHAWDWVTAKSNPEEFSCCHCRRDCPESAQCRIYQKTNERRRNTSMRKRIMIEDTLANDGDVEAILRKNGFL